MKNLNKVLAMVLVVVMAMTSVVFADFTDVTEETAYAEAINVGAALGLFNGYEDGTFAPEGDITRAEFAAIVVRALNQEAQAAAAANAASDFADVAEDHWAKGYINIVSKLGIVNGYGDGNFGPEDKVLYEQAIKMLVVALGYEPAIGTAGYPVGYLTKASEIGLTTGVKGSNGSAANRGIVAQLTVNSLNIPLMKQTGYGTWVDYEVQDGIYNVHRTLLSENLGMVKLSGIVTETSKSKATASHIDEYVTVDIINNYKTRFAKENGGDDVELNEDQDTKVYAGETNISSLVGVKTVIYAAYDELDQELVALYAAKDTTKANELAVAASDIEVVSFTAGDDYITFEYWENETDKKPEVINVAKNAAVYVNGLKETAATPSAVVGKLWRSGAAGFYGVVTLQLLNENSDADFDTIFIEDYETIVVDENNTNRFRIRAKNAGGIFSYDPEEKGIDVTLYDENGVEMDFADLVENDVFTYKEYNTANKKVVEAYKVTTTVTGAVTSIGGEAGDREYTIGGETYDACPLYIAEGDIALGDEGTFYLDLLGNIVDFDVTETVNTNYAYIVKVGTSGSTLDSRLALKLYTFDGQYGTINAASKIKVDGIANIDSETIVADTDIVLATAKSTADTRNLVAKQGSAWYTISGGQITAIDGLSAGQIITYSQNSAGYITSIDRAATDFTLADAKGKFTEYVAGAGDLEYKESSEALDTDTAGKLYITDKTVIMVAPTLNNAGTQIKAPTALKEDDFTLFSTENISDEQEFKNVRVFNVDEDKNVGFILVQTDVKMANAGAVMAVATGYSSANDDMGDPIYAIKVVQDGLYKDGKSEAALLTKDDNLYGVDKYVTFVPEYNAAGKVDGAAILAEVDAAGTTVSFNEAAGSEIRVENADLQSKVKYYYGEVTDIAKREFTITAGTYSKAGASRFTVANTTNVYVYYSGANANNKVTIEDYAVVEFDDTTGDIYFDTEEVTSVYAVAREYEGDVIDLVLYVIK